PYNQTARRDLYLEHAARLLASGHAYRCFCSPERLQRMRESQQRNRQPPRYDGTCRELDPAAAAARVAAGESAVVRFKMPREGTTTVHDHLRGAITIENRALD